MKLFERLGEPQTPTSWDRPHVEPLPPHGLPPVEDWLLLINFVVLMSAFAAVMVLGG